VIARRARWLLALALAAGCASGGGREPVAVPLDIASFNIRYGTAPDSANAWPNRRELVLDVLREQGPEVLGVQEALRFQLDELRRAFSRWGEVGVGRDDGASAGEYAAILYDTRRLEVLEQGSFRFSATPEVPGSASWGNEIPRICSWARFRDLETAHTFYVYNVHWDHESQASRDSSAVLLLRRIAAREHRADAVVVTGDFNAGEANPAYRTLLAGAARVEGAPRLIDTFRSVNPSARAVGTFHEFRGGRDGEKIDAVLVSPEWEILSAAIVRVAEEDRYPSDHFPVVASVQLGPVAASVGERSGGLPMNGRNGQPFSSAGAWK
jgi:endonuclease/exonuclease/phosphatase family metal-dependent hydrolase